MNRRRANIIPVSGDDYKGSNALKYDPEHCWTVRDLAQKGKFPETWCAEIGVTMQTLWNWANRYPEFDEAVRIAWHLLHHYWTEKAASLLTHPTAKQTLLLEIMRKRFPETWGENPRNTLEAWQFRPREVLDEGEEGGEAALDVSPEALGGMTDDDIQQRIAALEARRKHDRE